MLKDWVVIIAVFYLAFAATVYFIADRLIFLPPVSSYPAGRLPIVLVPADDGARIATLHLRNPGAAFTILFSHGNAEDLGHLSYLLEQMHRTGFSVLAYDYRGYGLSTGGPPTAEAAYRDLQAVYRHAVEHLEIPPERLIVLGRSVGSGPATELAAREPVGGLVIESGFVSAFRVVTRVQILPFDKFPNLRHIREVKCPVLVIHGTEDEVIPLSHGQRLFDAAPQPKQALWVENAGHNDLLVVAGPKYWQALLSFARLVGQHPVTPPA